MNMELQETLITELQIFSVIHHLELQLKALIPPTKIYLGLFHKGLYQQQFYLDNILMISLILSTNLNLFCLQTI